MKATKSISKSKWSLLLAFLFGSSLIHAQNTSFTMISVGYAYQNQSFGEVGGKILFTQKDTDNVAFRVGASALMGATNGKFAIMPKVHGDILFNPRKEVYVAHAYYYMAGVEATTKHFAPYLGISLFGLFDITGGYAFSYPNQALHGKELKGFRLGVTFNMPTELFKNSNQKTKE